MIEYQAINLDTRSFILLATIQQPVFSTVDALLKKDYRPLKPHLRKNDVLAEQLWQIDCNFHHVGGDHLFFRGPIRIRKCHCVSVNPRQRPAELHLEFAIDREYPPGFLRCHALYRAAQPVPAENHGEKNRHRNKYKKKSGNPFEHTRQYHDGMLKPPPAKPKLLYASDCFAFQLRQQIQFDQCM